MASANESHHRLSQIHKYSKSPEELELVERSDEIRLFRATSKEVGKE